ncbi:mitochondrial import receptor subunit TOM20 homolog [Drosophila pseudoobscura]|uniref:Mitochondrial import receptor subunit TOM20 homolog n=1 Tax=Drosophila pseudoobscura pseudoobscura TaxID=46245 RepID=A0A6I8V3C6_DROPS|nr:mitochondrial import receptor subunit TOM20 homolog [Drosophila pseudoobscura]
MALGTAGALFIGYCFYFDRKRTRAPDYKKRVHERRMRQAMSQLGGGTGQAGAADDNEEDDQDLVMQMHFVEEVKKGERHIKEGSVDEGLTHLCNAIMLCTHPGALLEMLQANLPEVLFRPLMMRLHELNQRSGSSSEDYSETSSYDTTRTSMSSGTSTSKPGEVAAAVTAAAQEAGL